MLGLGVMIQTLGGNQETVEAIKISLGKVIEKTWLDEDANCLKFQFQDKSILSLFDDGQSCCEERYMRTDDNLTEYTGAKLLDFELKTADNLPCSYGEHEIQFLDVKTDKGTFQMCSHNEHNGYYGGFYIKARVSFPYIKES